MALLRGGLLGENGLNFLSFWSCLTFLHHGIAYRRRREATSVKFHKKIERKSWSNVPPKLLACISGGQSVTASYLK